MNIKKYFSMIIVALVACAMISGCSHKEKSSGGEAVPPGEKTAAGDSAGDKFKGDGDSPVVNEGGKVEIKEFGLPIYPNAELQESKSIENANSGPSKNATLKTTDSLEKVFAFYKENLKGAKMQDRIASNGSAFFQVTDGKTPRTVYIIKEPEDPKYTFITLSVGDMVVLP